MLTNLCAPHHISYTTAVAELESIALDEMEEECFLRL